MLSLNHIYVFFDIQDFNRVSSIPNVVIGRTCDLDFEGIKLGGGVLGGLDIIDPLTLPTSSEQS